MTIHAKVSVPAHKVRHIEITLEDLGLTKYEWDNLSEEDRGEEIAHYVGDLDPVCWEVDNYTVSEQ